MRGGGLRRQLLLVLKDLGAVSETIRELKERLGVSLTELFQTSQAIVALHVVLVYMRKLVPKFCLETNAA